MKAIFKFLKFLDALEKQMGGFFWILVSLFGLTFSSLNDMNDSYLMQPNIRPRIEISSALRVPPGGRQEPQEGFILPGQSGNDGITDRGPDRLEDYDPKPRFPWGVDPAFKRGSGGSCSGIDNNRVPEPEKWDTDPNSWGKEESEKEAEPAPGKLSVPGDFPYQYDDKGNPTLLVPNSGKTGTRRKYTKVEFDQTAAHMHHAPDFNINLPDHFDMDKYKSLSRADKIQYATENLSPEIIIGYQNAIGKSISPMFVPAPTGGIDFLSLTGTAGIDKIPTDLTIAPTRSNPDIFMLGIIRQDGVHISSFPISKQRLIKLSKDNFWVLKQRDIK